MRRRFSRVTDSKAWAKTGRALRLPSPFLAPILKRLPAAAFRRFARLVVSGEIGDVGCLPCRPVGLSVWAAMSRASSSASCAAAIRRCRSCASGSRRRRASSECAWNSSHCVASTARRSISERVSSRPACAFSPAVFRLRSDCFLFLPHSRQASRVVPATAQGGLPPGARLRFDLAVVLGRRPGGTGGRRASLPCGTKGDAFWSGAAGAVRAFPSACGRRRRPAPTPPACLAAVSPFP